MMPSRGQLEVEEDFKKATSTKSNSSSSGYGDNNDDINIAQFRKEDGENDFDKELVQKQSSSTTLSSSTSKMTPSLHHHNYGHLMMDVLKEDDRHHRPASTTSYYYSKPAKRNTSTAADAATTTSSLNDNNLQVFSTTTTTTPSKTKKRGRGGNNLLPTNSVTSSSTTTTPVSRTERRNSSRFPPSNNLFMFLKRQRLISTLVLLYLLLGFLSLVHQMFVLEYTTNSSSLKDGSSGQVGGRIIESRLAEFANSSTRKPLATTFSGKHHQVQLEEKLDLVGDPNNKTLALLYPLGMIGGYRNQVIRFISLVRYAINNNISQILLPSVVWTTTHEVTSAAAAGQEKKRFFPVPMDMLFDINYWNREFALKGQLPLLMTNSKLTGSDCWGLHDTQDYRLPDRSHKVSAEHYVSPLAQKVLDENALLTPVVNYSRGLLSGELQIRPRKFNLFPQIKDCQHPVVYGGGSGGGKLWNDYVSMPKVGIRNKITPEAVENTRVINLVDQALIPSKQWRSVAHQCILQHQTTSKGTTGGNSNNHNEHFNIAALHARVETDMMKHKCGRYMQKNLTKIFHMVDDLVEIYNSGKTPENQMHGVFLAVSRQGMQTPVNNTEVQTMADYNWDALLERSITQTTRAEKSPSTKNVKKSNAVDVFECGELWTDRWYAEQLSEQQSQHQMKDDVMMIEHDHYGSILPSILNFYIATHASMFIGVQGSSWSTDVWNTRYHQGTGDGNYVYTKGRIKPIPDGGLPPPHQNCKEIKFENETSKDL